MISLLFKVFTISSLPGPSQQLCPQHGAGDAGTTQELPSGKGRHEEGVGFGEESLVM